MKKLFLIVLLGCFVLPQSVFAFGKKNSAAIENKGYIGTLPDVTQRFPSSVPKESTPEFQYKDGFNNQDDIKPAPRDNPAFVNIIIKRDKTSQYINDLNSIIAIIEKLEDLIEDSGNVQKFNSESYFLKANVDYFRDKYKNSAEGSYISFKKLMQLNTHVQTVAQLRLERESYSPYVTAAQSGNMFTQNNIENQISYLLDDIKSTLVVLKEAK